MCTGVHTKLAGARSISPMPPPFRRPWLSVVTIHMMSESQLLSLKPPPTDTNRGPRRYLAAGSGPTRHDSLEHASLS